MRYTVYNIEENTMVLDVVNKRLGIITQILCPAPYIQVEVLFVGSTTSEILDQYKLTNPLEYRIIPTFDIHA